MSLVLDKSGSMNRNGGSQALPPAVTNFVNYFDDNNDQVAEVSFSSVAATDVTIRTGFVSPITNAVSSMAFGGATYAQGGLLNGQTEIESVPVVQGGERCESSDIFHRRVGEHQRGQSELPALNFFELWWMCTSRGRRRVV